MFNPNENGKGELFLCRFDYFFNPNQNFLYKTVVTNNYKDKIIPD